jgi:hypothetical protein
MAIKKKPRKKGPVVAKSIVYDGIKFSSGLEKNMYMLLKKAGIKFEYEGETYTLFEGFNFMTECYERQSNGKGEYRNRGGNKLLPIKYTPDFVGNNFIIETKGRANESFPLRWKMFKKYATINLPNVVLYKPQNIKECEETIRLILEKQRKSLG